MMKKTTTIRLVRNATLRINYAGHNILVDPFFADNIKGHYALY